MRTIKNALRMAALGAALFLVPALASASDGIAAHASQIAEPARASLLTAVNAHRAAHPEDFDAVRDVKGHRPEVYNQFRKPVPEVSRELRRLGPSALLPMLNALAFEAPARGDLTDREWDALTVGLLDAVGVLRDPRSGPVLRAVFEGSSKSAPVARAAAQAMGRLCGDAELALLQKRAGAGDSLRLAAIAGLAECRRVESAKQLASLFAANPDAASAEAITAALGSVGSSWAWRAMGPASEATGRAVREIAAKALVSAFARSKGDIREPIRKALLMTEHAGTSELITQARVSADAETAAALDALLVRVQRAAPRP